jgi:nucleotide-binding universal stress UspA family protein
MYRRILVPIDGSVTSSIGLEEAARLANHCGASLRLIHAVDRTGFTTGYEALGPQTGQEIASIEARPGSCSMTPRIVPRPRVT